MINSDKVAAWLRTAVPIGWGALVAFLLSRFPSLHELLVNPAVTMVVTGAVVVAWYSLWRWLEPRLPAWLTILVMGYDRSPSYFTGEIYDNGYRAGQDDAIPSLTEINEGTAFQESPAGLDNRLRSISRPGESSGPHALTDIVPPVRDETGGGEATGRG